MRILILLFALISQAGLFAQRTQFITVRAGNNIMDVLSAADVFQYSQFTTGAVFLRNGSRTEAKLNYNRLVDEMHFINPNGDTLALADGKDISYVAIGNDTFYYDQGYIRLLPGGDRVKIAVRQVWLISDVRQVGAFNSTNNSVSITSYTSVTEGGRIYDLTVNEDVILKRVEEHFFGDRYNRFVLATKKNLLMLFSKEERRIEAYLRENKIDFSSRKDLEQVVRFLQTL